uniref:Uncharacterized protein n=1 Tax=Esox lucius TaxID=8010 RepID=A0AAY5L0Z9_ESOLU
ISAPHPGHLRSTPWPSLLHTLAIFAPHPGHLCSTPRPSLLHTLAIFAPHPGHLCSTPRPSLLHTLAISLALAVELQAVVWMFRGDYLLYATECARVPLPDHETENTILWEYAERNQFAKCGLCSQGQVLEQNGT